MLKNLKQYYQLQRCSVDLMFFFLLSENLYQDSISEPLYEQSPLTSHHVCLSVDGDTQWLILKPFDVDFNWLALLAALVSRLC